MSEGVVKRCTVIGNGRTLKDFDFTKIKEDTIGLTMAIRHWYKINWFPDYYVNVDHVVLPVSYTHLTLPTKRIV